MLMSSRIGRKQLVAIVLMNALVSNAKVVRVYSQPCFETTSKMRSSSWWRRFTKRNSPLLRWRGQINLSQRVGLVLQCCQPNISAYLQGGQLVPARVTFHHVAAPIGCSRIRLEWQGLLVSMSFWHRTLTVQNAVNRKLPRANTFFSLAPTVSNCALENNWTVQLAWTNSEPFTSNSSVQTKLRPNATALSTLIFPCAFFIKKPVVHKIERRVIIAGVGSYTSSLDM